ncbi:MAG TPA: glycosyltransferase family 1 protein [Candidatus Eisenbacteria bacterium]|nr:glycosyltransferase family 1 protein [Candidatus Eisenbacteria bacterium]
MRIGIGALVGILGGPATYARELVRALAREAQHEYVVFTDRPEAFAGEPVEVVHVPLASSYHQVTWDHVRLPGLIRRHGVALYHGTKAVLPLRCAVPAVVTVHDLAVYACPETFAWPQRLHFRLCVPPSIARAARVVAVSEHARGDVIAHFGLPPDRVIAVPNGVAEVFRSAVPPGTIDRLRGRHGLGERLVACVGTVQPRKHVERVIDAFGRAGGPSRGWQLAIAGRLRPGHAPSWTASPPAGVRWLGALGDDDLHALYAAAPIFVSASEYEGFGLTVCEAMASGAAVVAVGASSLPEVVGDAGLLVQRSDAALLAPAIAKLIDDASLRAELGTRARARAARFTWDEAARRTRTVYEQAVAS